MSSLDTPLTEAQLAMIESAMRGDQPETVTRLLVDEAPKEPQPFVPEVKAFYRQDDGEKVYVPRGPIERADIHLPGPVARPDGSVVMVELE